MPDLMLNNSQSPSAPRQEAHTSLYSQSSSCPRSTCEGGTPSLQAGDARRSACAALVFRRALASWQAYQIVNSHTALPLILSQKGVDSQRAPFHHEEVAMNEAHIPFPWRRSGRLVASHRRRTFAVRSLPARLHDAPRSARVLLRARGA
jgi:hypothetical protein